MPEGAMTSFTVCDAYRYFVVINVTKLVTQKIFNTDR